MALVRVASSASPVLRDGEYYQKVLLLVDGSGAKAKVLLAMEKVRQRAGRHRAVTDHLM
jgi:hypothetical protein